MWSLQRRARGLAGCGERPGTWGQGLQTRYAWRSCRSCSIRRGSPAIWRGKAGDLSKAGGAEDRVRDHLDAAGRDYDHELKNLYVSPYLAEALIEVSPTFGESVADVGRRLQEQFPDKTDITNEELLDTVEDVLKLQSEKDGELPLTLIVLDEMQQFIGEDGNRAEQVQHIAEGCAARFESRLLLVATGQGRANGNPNLAEAQRSISGRCGAQGHGCRGRCA